MGGKNGLELYRKKKDLRYLRAHSVSNFMISH
jgi:hypothetical protein